MDGNTETTMQCDLVEVLRELVLAPMQVMAWNHYSWSTPDTSPTLGL